MCGRHRPRVVKRSRGVSRACGLRGSIWHRPSADDGVISIPEVVSTTAVSCAPGPAVVTISRFRSVEVAPPIPPGAEIAPFTSNRRPPSLPAVTAASTSARCILRQSL